MTEDSHYYMVMRRVQGQVSIAAQGIAALDDARRIAAKLRQRDSGKHVRFYVQAPRRAPIEDRGLADGSSVQDAPQEASSENPQSRPAAHGDTQVPVTPSAPSATPRRPTKLSKPTVRFVLYRVREAQREQISDGFATHYEARDHALALQEQHPDPTVRYEVVYHVPPSRAQVRPSKPTPTTSAQGRGQRPRLPRPESKERPRHTVRREWEDEDEYNDGYRYDDRFPRPDDLLGIGIPAQANRGRRSRRGLYIP